MITDPLMPRGKKNKKGGTKRNTKGKKKSPATNGRLRDSDYRLHPDFWAANDRFWEELPQMLTDAELFSRLVVFTPTGRVPNLVGDDDLKLAKECDHRGLERGHYVIARVLPDLPSVEIRENWL
jgi:hypothetical protein